MSDEQKIQKFPFFDQEQVETLRSRIQGKVVLPGEDGYDKARQTWDAKTFDQHPALIVLPAGTSDVQVAVSFAHEHGLPVGVQGGGHGHPHPVDDALLVNFANMTNIQIDAEHATAHVEPGVVFKSLVQAAHEHGLAPLNGFAPTVGVVGYMLGGGLGWLARRYGPGAASIRSVELVTAEGQLLQVSESSSPDLFWGLRGGGGNFGIVTSLQCQLYPVKDIFAGQVVYAIEQGKDVLSTYLKWTESVPDELTSALRITHFPDSPDLPPPLRGASTIIVMACYTGTDEQGETLLAPMRSLGKVLLDTFDRIPYSKVGTISNDPEDAAPLFLYNESGAFQTFLAKDIEAIIDIPGKRDSGIFQAEIRHLAGALARQPEDAMAFNCRNANFYLNVQAIAPSPDQLSRAKGSIATLKKILQSEIIGETLINFLDAGNVGPYLTRIAYSPHNFERLRALKERYDPTNMFRFNHNIPIDA